MTSIRRHCFALPDSIIVTIIRLTDALPAVVLREMLNVELYLLAGTTFSPDGRATGYGGYIGTSGALTDSLARCGVSLRQWAFRGRRLHPEVVVLVSRPGRPMNPRARLLVEASLVRAIDPDYSLLNTIASAPTAGARATRSQRLWAMYISERLVGLLQGRVFYPHPGKAEGGTTREQLVRLLLAQRPPRAMNTRQILGLAADCGLVIPGRTPVQRTRRDLTTRESAGASGRPRLLRTHIDGITVIYPAGMTVRQARADYRAHHPDAPHVPALKPCQGQPPARRRDAS